MPEQTRWATAVLINPGAWSNPTQALNAPDGLCASKTCTPGAWDLVVGTYSFSIPGTATVNAVYYGFYSFCNYGVYVDPNNRTKLVFAKISPFQQEIRNGSFFGSSGGCADVGWDEWLWGGAGFTASEINSEQFLTTIRGYTAYGINFHYCDAVRVRVVYTEAAPAVAQPLGDGLTFVQVARRKSWGCVGIGRSLLRRPSA